MNYKVERKLVKERITRIQNELYKQGVRSLFVLSPPNTYYLSGFQATAYTRPIIVVISESPYLIVPELEYNNAKEKSFLQDVYQYSDLELGGREERSPLELALEIAVSYIKEREIGLEETSPWIAFKILQEKFTINPIPVKGVVEKIRAIKDEQEINLIRQGCKLADFGMKVEKELSIVGASEIEIMSKGNAAMECEGAKLFPEWTLKAGSRPVSGSRTALPHALPTGRRLACGDSIIHGTGVVIEGYHSEDERTFFLGYPKEEILLKVYRDVTKAQEEAIESIRPGRECREIDSIARTILIEAGWGDYIIHRTGHSIGLEGHETPFFSSQNYTKLSAGMVVTVEPGIYLPGIGGVRHSDTVLVTEEGTEVLTKFSKNLEDAIIPL